MNPLGLLHTGAAVLALAAGAVVLLQREGTRLHRRIGWAYVASMATMNGTALLIHRLFGGFGPFHLVATVFTFGVGATMIRRRAGATLAPFVRAAPPTS